MLWGATKFWALFILYEMTKLCVVFESFVMQFTRVFYCLTVLCPIWVFVVTVQALM